MPFLRARTPVRLIPGSQSSIRLSSTSFATCAGSVPAAASVEAAAGPEVEGSGGLSAGIAWRRVAQADMALRSGAAVMVLGVSLSREGPAAGLNTLDGSAIRKCIVNRRA